MGPKHTFYWDDSDWFIKLEYIFWCPSQQITLIAITLSAILEWLHIYIHNNIKYFIFWR